MSKKDFEYDFETPSQVLDRMFAGLHFHIKKLEAEVVKLREENRTLLYQNISLGDKAALRTVYMAANGCLPKPGSDEYKAMGYGEESNPDEDK